MQRSPNFWLYSLAYCYLLPLLCSSLPIFDQLCVRLLNFVQRCLSHDSDIVKFRPISDYCIKYGRSNSCIGKNVMFCMQRYKCNVEMVFSGQMNNIIESRFIRSTDCVHVALANMLFEIIMVWDGVLSLPRWFSCDLIDDVLSVYSRNGVLWCKVLLLLFSLFLLYACLSCTSCTIS